MSKPNIPEYRKACQESLEQFKDGLISRLEYETQLMLAWKKYIKEYGCNK